MRKREEGRERERGIEWKTERERNIEGGGYGYAGKKGDRRQHRKKQRIRDDRKRVKERGRQGKRGR